VDPSMSTGNHWTKPRFFAPKQLESRQATHTVQQL